MAENPRLVAIGLAGIVFVGCAVMLVQSSSPTVSEREAAAIAVVSSRYFDSLVVRLPLYLASFLLAIDGTGYWSSGRRRYLIVLLVLVPLVSLLPGKQTTRSIPWYFLVLGWLMGLVGSLIAFGRGDPNTWLQVFLPLTIAVVVGTLDLSSDQRPQFAAAVHALAISSSVISIVGALTWVIGLRSHSGLGFLRQEMAFVYLAAVVLSWVVGYRLLLIGNLASLAVAFYAYPAATYPIVVGSLMLAMLSFSPRRGRLRRWLGGVGLASLIGVGGWLILTASALTRSYAQRVGKLDNSAFRRELWLRGLKDFGKSPIYGSMWTGPYNVIDLNVPGIIEFSAPIHNEYISVLRSGGSLGFVLIVLPLIAIFRPRRSTVGKSGSGQLRGHPLEVSVKACAVAFLVASFFNPLWAKTSTALFGWLLVGLAMASSGTLETQSRSGASPPIRETLAASDTRLPLRRG